MPRTPGTWTPDQARAMTLRRRELRAQRQANAAAVDVQPSGPTPQPTPAAFIAEVQDRIRAHVRSVLDILDRELATVGPKGGHRPIDGTQVDRLASALERLTELERVLDGRPAPGTLRPSTAAPRTPARAPLQPLDQEAPGLSERPEW